MLQDGSERVIESLSLIDAVMPDVVESRKQAAAKSQQLNKAEANNTNGEEGAAPALGMYQSGKTPYQEVMVQTQESTVTWNLALLKLCNLREKFSEGVHNFPIYHI